MVMLNNNFKQNFSNLQNKEQASLKNHNDTKQDFNIFTILRKTGEEVGLHSRFLAELLNRNASHKIADFQQLFIETVLNTLLLSKTRFMLLIKKVNWLNIIKLAKNWAMTIKIFT